jgi:DNA end-binding protein Ku
LPRKPKAEAGSSAHESGAEGGGRARAFWSGTISFGLVTIPVELFSATHESRRSLRMIAPSGKPVSRRYFSEDGKPLEGHIARGYQIDDAYVVVTDDELEALAPEQSRDIELSRFVDKDAISALFFEHAYVMAPAGNSNAAYRLLASTLENSGKAGIARFVMRGKQYPVAIFGAGGLLRAHTMRFAEELRTAEAIGLPEPKVDARKAKSMRSLIAKHKLRGTPEELLAAHDDKEQKLEAAVRKKQKAGEDVVHVDAEDAAPMAEVIDLVAILKQSLGQGGSSAKSASKTATKTASKPATKKAAKPAAKRAPAKKKRAAPGR